MDFKKMSKVSISEEIIDYLKDQILTKKLLPGSRLPSEESLASSMGVGRGTIREALKVLIHLGLIERKKNATYVTERNNSDKLNLDIQMDKYRDLIEIIEVRKVIEPALAELAAIRANEEIINEIESKLLQMQNSKDDIDQFIIHDSEFHDLVFKASGNHILEGIIKGSKNLMKKNQRIVLKERYIQIMPRSLSFHQDIFDAIRSHDQKKAYDMMFNHIVDIENEFKIILASK